MFSIKMPIASVESVDSRPSAPSRTITKGAVNDESSAVSRGTIASQTGRPGRSNASVT